ncbi:MAG: M16 family metallopeptidase [Candidatus Gastranaerophilaceae bacterium]
MNTIKNYNINQTNVITQGVSKPSFTAEQQPASDKQITELTNVTPDYHVKTPMAYRFVKDIKLSDNLTAKVYKLANGQNVIIAPKDGQTFVKTYVNTGSFNEPDNLRGISHYIEHNLFNGSEDLGDKVFFDEVNKMGASTNASTSFGVTDYFIITNQLEDTDLENSIQLHAGMLQSPKFLLDKLEKEKNIVNSEINMYMAEDESLGFTQMIKNLYNIKSSSLDLVAGNTDNITALTREDVINYFNNNYYPTNMTTVITGEVDPDKTMQMVSKYFTSTQTPQGERHFETMIPIEKTVRQDIISPKSEGKASIFMGFAGTENNNAKEKIYLGALFELAGGLSNSRTANLERKYNTSINFFSERLSSRPQDKKLLAVETSIPDNKVEIFLKDLYAAIDDLSKNPPTENELKAIKNRMKKEHNDLMEVSGGINSYIGYSFLNNDMETLTNYDKIIDEMTADDIVNVAKKYLDLNKTSLTVVHPSTAKEEEINNNYKKLSSVSFTGRNKKVPLDINSVSKYRMANNYEIVLNDSNTNNVIYVLSLKEKESTPKNAVISRILNNMLTNSGSQQKSIEECSKTEDILGLETGLTTGYNGLGQYGEFPIDSSKDSIEYLQERIKNPDLNEKTFKKAVEDIRTALKNREVSAYDTYNKVMNEGTPYVSPKEIEESLDTITLDDVKNFYNEAFVKGMGKVVVTAPFSKHPELKQQIFNAIGTYGKAQPVDVSLNQVYKPIETAQVYTEANKKNQAKILQGYKFKNSGNLKDKTCVTLLNQILGGSPSSRLFMDLRETRHLAYSVGSDVSYNDDIGIFTLSIGTTTENLETGEKTFDNIKKSIDGFNDNIKKITTEKITQEELDNAKRNFKSDLLSSLETGAGKNSMIEMGNDSLYGIDYMNQVFEEIDKITVDDIYNTANNIFAGKPIYSLTATQASLDANKDFLQSLTK